MIVPTVTVLALLTFTLSSYVSGADRQIRDATTTSSRPPIVVTFTSGPRRQDIRCYDCKNNNGDCITGGCGGTFCHTQILKNEVLNHTTVVTKSCSREGPPGNGDLCSFSSVGGTEQISCYCRCGHYCSNREYLEFLYAKTKGMKVDGSLFGPAVFSPNAQAACGLYNSTEPEKSSAVINHFSVTTISLGLILFFILLSLY